MEGVKLGRGAGEGRRRGDQRRPTETGRWWFFYFSKKMFVVFFFEKNVCRVYFGHSAKSLLSVRQKTLGKVCLPIKIHRVSFAERDTRQTLCQVFFRLCRVPGALGKSPDSRSEVPPQPQT